MDYNIKDSQKYYAYIKADKELKEWLKNVRPNDFENKVVQNQFYHGMTNNKIIHYDYKIVCDKSKEIISECDSKIKPRFNKVIISKELVYREPFYMFVAFIVIFLLIMLFNPESLIK